MSKPILSYDRLRELVHYDPETGVFTRLTKTGSRWLAGQIATPTMDSNGYAQLFVAGKKRAAHRLAWLYVYGTYPLGQVDHINGIQTDNRIANLRDTTPSENCQNKHGARSDSTSGLIGVTPRPTGNWRARIVVRSKRIMLGDFPTAHLAHAAYLAAKREFHSTCTI